MNYYKNIFILISALFLLGGFLFLVFNPVNETMACCEETYKVAGLKFNDKDGDGERECGEELLAGWTITIEGSCQFSKSTVTEYGLYFFTGLYPGTYTVCEVLKDGWEQTYPTDNNGCHIIEITNKNITGINFGNREIEEEPVCGNEILEGEEECDEGEDNGVVCEPTYGSSCQYCSTQCELVEVQGPYCGDNEINGEEECEIDDDCDCGYVCENCVCQIITECTPQDTQPCDTSELGVCASGTKTCSAEGFWGGCIRNNEPSTEVCDNGLDDDCDGLTDCDDEDCSQDPACQEPQCEYGETQPCDTGQLGVCASGTQTCNEQGFWGECVQDNEPGTEVCNDELDNDCDGDIDCDDEDCTGDPFCQEPEPVCGNSVLEEGEQCDDGNTESGDGCSSQCYLETS